MAEPVGRYLSLAERDENMRLDAAGPGVRAITRALGRDPATISRDLARCTGTRGYRASVAQAHAERGRRQPRAARLASHLGLRCEVQARLERRISRNTCLTACGSPPSRPPESASTFVSTT